ncbi:MAG: transcription antitermination factor NusB [Alphaproteobacteria bacterium]
MSKASQGSAAGPAAKSAARLMAVQALYQIALTGAPASHVEAEFLRHRVAGGELEGAHYTPADRALFVDLVRGVAGACAELDALIAAVLPEDWALKRLEMVLLAILRCGVYELRQRAEVPPKVTITEYVDVAHGFYGGKEPAMTNAILDRLARELRAQEMGGAPDPAAGSA